jgi:lysozyme family protein
MAKFENFAGKLLRLEGGYVNHPLDKGGPTKYGVILSVWQEHGHDKDGDGDIDAEDIKKLTEEDARYIAKKIFWDYFLADHISNESVAEFIVDWGYNSGRKTVAKIVQRLVNVEVDGTVGIQTLRAINSTDQERLFNLLKIERKVFLNNIIRRKPDQIVFYDGWMNRVNSFKYAWSVNKI